MHSPEIVIGPVTGKGGKNLDTHSLEIVHHDFLIALDIILADIIDHVIAGDFRFDLSDLILDPGDIDLVVSARLARPSEPGRIADEDIDIRHLFHHFLGDRIDIIADQRGSAGLVDGHAFDIGKRLECFNDVLLEHFFGAEHDMLFLHIRRIGILELEVVIVADIALGLPCVVGAADRPMTDMDNILHGRADNMLGSAVRAPAFRNRPRNGVEVSEGKGRRQILAVTFDHSVLFPFRNTLTAFKLMIWHNYSLLY